MELVGLGPYPLLFSFCCETGIKKKQRIFTSLPIPLHYKKEEVIPDELREGLFCRRLIGRRLVTLNGPKRTFILYISI